MQFRIGFGKRQYGWVARCNRLDLGIGKFLAADVFGTAGGVVAGYHLADEPGLGFQRLPHVSVERSFRNVAIDCHFLVFVALAQDAATSSSPLPGNASLRHEVRHAVERGRAWLEAESTRRFGARFAEAAQAERESLCADISAEAPTDSELGKASRFFRKFRDLVAAGYFTTPAGMKDLGYVGNVPLATFDGPPADLVAKLGLTDEVKW